MLYKLKPKRYILLQEKLVWQSHHHETKELNIKRAFFDTTFIKRDKRHRRRFVGQNMSLRIQNLKGFKEVLVRDHEPLSITGIRNKAVLQCVHP